MIYFTSDLFLSRPQSAKTRGFASIQEMDDHIITNWNELVKPEDLVYHLGNFAWDPIGAEDGIQKLNGTIAFISGDWDLAIRDILGNIPQHEILKEEIVLLDALDLVISHWPLLDWPGMNDKTIHIHGGSKHKSVINKESIRINCNTELWSYKPINLDTIMNLIDMFSEQPNEIK
jgi:calcineurin-like phosphoesterase family protein